MRTKETPQKTRPPQIVKLDRALKLAEQWLNKMTKTEENEPKEVEPECRPPRLGLGAKVPRQIKRGPSNDPVDRKLYAKLDAGKRKAARSSDNSTHVNGDCDHDSGDELESRTAVFDKKRVAVSATYLQPKKKQK